MIWSSVPKEILRGLELSKDAKQFCQACAAGESRSQRDRRAELRQIVARLRRWPSVREARRLLAEAEIHVSHRTVVLDLQSLRRQQ